MSEIGEYFIYAVFVLGIVLVLIGDNVFDFGQTWIWLSMMRLHRRARRLPRPAPARGAAGCRRSCTR